MNRLFVLILLSFSFLANAATIVGKVVGVADGDTLTVLDETKTMHKVRLEGLDCPEKKQAFGTQAKWNLSKLAFGKPAEVIYKKRDRYQRVLGKVMVEGKDVGLEQIKAGLGWHYRQYAKEQQPDDRVTYSDAEAAAKSAKQGLWTEPEPVAPWEFRRQRKAIGRR